MKFIQPYAEWWPQQTIVQQIARVGRICYKSTPQEPSSDLSDEEKEQFIENRDQKRTDAFWKSGHRSMYRHGTVYYFVPNDKYLPQSILSFINASAYIGIVVRKHHAYISTNLQFIREHAYVQNLLEPFQVSEDEFIDIAMKHDCKRALMLIRMTFVCTTQISTTRELNRTSPNCISEQSTRYVNMKKKGGVKIAKPHWYDGGKMWHKLLFYCGCKVSEWTYRLLLLTGMKPQDARGVLPLDTYSMVAYTYNLFEWRHILDLRYRGTTGNPHKNAYIIAEQISDIINQRMRLYIPDFEI